VGLSRPRVCRRALEGLEPHAEGKGLLSEERFAELPQDSPWVTFLVSSKASRQRERSVPGLLLSLLPHTGPARLLLHEMIH